jgi:hypothetical protein
MLRSDLQPARNSHLKKQQQGLLGVRERIERPGEKQGLRRVEEVMECR